MDITPIETRFDGILFRSRTEARWAVFFRALGLAYQYENEGYDIDGTWYLPDFYIPEWKMFVEVKPYGPPEQRALYLVSGLQKLSGKRAVIFAGSPAPSRYQVWLNLKPPNVDISPVLLGDCRRCETGVDYYSEQGFGGGWNCRPGCSSEKWPVHDDAGRIGRALAEAASARFETVEGGRG